MSWGDPGSFGTDAAKTTYLASLLEGDAWTWYSNQLKEARKTEPDLVSAFNVVVGALLAFYQDPNEEATAVRKLMNIKQGKSLCLDYSLRFLTLANLTSWDDKTRREFYYRGLNDDIKDVLVQSLNPPETLAALSQKAQEVDQLLQVRKEEKRANASVPAGTPTTTNFARVSSSRGFPHHRPVAARLDVGEPMVLDATLPRRGPLTRAERERRLRLNLCHYCGSDQHLLAQCDQKPRQTQNVIIQETQEAAEAEDQTEN